MRRCKSTNLELKATSQHLSRLQRLPSIDMLTRSDNEKSDGNRSLKNLKILNTSCPAKERSNSVGGLKPNKIVQLPSLKNNNRLRICSQARKRHLSLDRPIIKKSPASTLLNVSEELKREASGRFVYAIFDEKMNYVIIDAEQALKTKRTYSTISGEGVILCDSGDPFFIPRDKIKRTVDIFHKLSKNEMFRTFMTFKLFRRWKNLIKFKFFLKSRMQIERNLDYADKDLRQSMQNCLKQVQRLSIRRIITVVDFEPIPLSKYKTYLKTCSQNVYNIIKPQAFCKIIKSALKPVKTRIQRTLGFQERIQDNNGRIDFQATFNKRLSYGGAQKFIRKILYMMLDAKIRYLQNCYDELVSKISKSLKIYMEKHKKHIMNYLNRLIKLNQQVEPVVLSNDRQKEIESIVCQLTLQQNIECHTTEKAVVDVVHKFLIWLTAMSKDKVQNLQHLDQVERDAVGEMMQKFDNYQGKCLGDCESIMAQQMIIIGSTIKQNFQEVRQIQQIYNILVQEVRQYMENKSKIAYQERLQILLVLLSRCRKGFLDFQVGFLYLRVSQVQAYIIQKLQEDQQTIMKQIPQEFQLKLRELQQIVGSFASAIRHSIMGLENFVESYRKVEEYEEAKYEMIKKFDSLKQLINIMTEMKHTDRARLLPAFTQIESAISQLELKVKFFKNKIEQEVDTLKKQAAQLAQAVNMRLKRIQYNCQQNLEQSFTELLIIINSQMYQLHSVQKSMENVEVIERLASVKQTQFSLAKILDYELSNIIYLLEQYGLFKQLYSQFQNQQYRMVDLTQIIIFVEQSVYKIMNKSKPLHQFQILLNRLLRYFNKHKEAFKAIRNLQLLDESDCRLIEDTEDPKQNHRKIEQYLTKSKTVAQLVDNNVQELYQMTCQLVKKKERSSQLTTLLKVIEADWESIEFRLIQSDDTHFIDNLPTILDKMEQYQLQLSYIYSVKGSINDRMDNNYKMIEYCINMTQNLIRLQESYRQLLPHLNGKAIYTAAWLRITQWLKAAKLEKVGKDHHSKTLEYYLNNMMEMIKNFNGQMEDIAYRKCAEYPKLFFLSKTDVMKIMEAWETFFSHYYPSIVSVEFQKQLILKTQLGEIIKLPELEGDFLENYDIQLRRNIRHRLQISLDERLVKMIKQKQLSQIIICVDMINEHKKVGKHIRQPSQTCREQARRMSQDIQTFLKAIKLAPRKPIQHSYELTTYNMLIMTRIYLRERLLEPDGYYTFIEYREGQFYLNCQGRMLKLHYEPIMLTHHISSMPQSDRTYCCLMTVLTNIQGAYVKDWQSVEELACLVMAKMNISCVGEQKHVRKMIGAINTDAWCCFNMVENHEVLSNIAEIITRVKICLNEKKNSMIYMGKQVNVKNMPTVFLRGSAEKYEQLPMNVKAYFRTIQWVGSSMVEMAKCHFQCRGVEDEWIVGQTLKMLQQFDNEINLRYKNQNSMHIVKKILDNIIDRYGKVKPTKLQLLQVIKKYLNYTGLHDKWFMVLEATEQMQQPVVVQTTRQKHKEQVQVDPQSFSSKIKEFQSCLESLRCIFVVGERLSGKTALWQAALKNVPHYEHIKVNRLNLLGMPNKAIIRNGEFCGILPKLLNDPRQWLILDNFFQEHHHIEGLFEDVRSITVNGRKIEIENTIKVIFEVTSMSQMSLPLIIGSEKVVLSVTAITTKEYFLGKLQRILENCISNRFHQQLKEQFNKIYNNIDPLIKQHFKPFVLHKNATVKYVLSCLFSIFEALIPSRTITEEQNPFSIVSLFQKVFYYCLGVVLHMLSTEDQKNLIDKYIKEELLKKQSFLKHFLFDSIFDRTATKQGLFYVPQNEHTTQRLMMQNIEHVYIKSKQSFFVKNLMENLARAGRHINIYGEKGTGKSIFLKSILKNRNLSRINKEWTTEKLAENLIKITKITKGKPFSKLMRKDSLDSTIVRPDVCFVTIQDLSMSNNPLEMSHFTKSMLENGYFYSMELGVKIMVSRVQLILEDRQPQSDILMDAELFPFKLSFQNNHFEKVYQMIVFHILQDHSRWSPLLRQIDIYKKSQDISRCALSFMKAMNQAKLQNKNYPSLSQAPTRNMYFFDIKKSIINNLKYLVNDITLKDEQDLHVIFYHSLMELVDVYANNERQYNDFSGIAQSKIRDLVGVSQLADLNQQDMYFLEVGQNDKVIKMERECMEEELRSKIWKKYKNNQLINYNIELLDFLYRLTLAMYFKQHITIGNFQRLPNCIHLLDTIKLFTENVINIDRKIDTDKFIDVIRYVLTKESYSLTYLLLASGCNYMNLNNIMDILQKIACSDEESLDFEGKTVNCSDFKKKIRIIYCMEEGYREQAAAQQFKTIFRQCQHILVRKMSKHTVEKLISITIDSVQDNQVGRLITHMPQKQQIKMGKKRQMGRKSSGIRYKPVQQSPAKHLKQIVYRVYYLYERVQTQSQTEQFRMYFEKHSRLYQFLTILVNLMNNKQNSLMFNKRILESSKEALNSLSEYIDKYKQTVIETARQLRAAQAELEKVTKMRNESYLRYMADIEDHNNKVEQLHKLERQVQQIKSDMENKKQSAKKCRQVSQNAFNNINRGDLSEMKAEFVNNYHMMRPLYESICELMNESTDINNIKKVIFDTNFKSKLREIRFSKCQESTLKQIIQRFSANQDEFVLLAARNLYDWIYYGAQSQLLKNTLPTDLQNGVNQLARHEQKIEELRNMSTMKSTDEYKNVCEQENIVQLHVQAIELKKKTLESQNKYIQELQKLKALQADWQQLVESNRKEEEHQIFKSIQSALILSFGGIFRSQQMKSYKNYIASAVSKSTMVKPTTFQLQAFIHDVCKSVREYQMPSHPQTNEKMCIILYALQHLHDHIVLFSTQFEVEMYFNCKKCVYLNPKRNGFQEKLLNCLAQGMWTFIIMDGYEDNCEIMENIRKRQYEIRNKKEYIRHKGKYFLVSNSFRLIMIRNRDQGLQLRQSNLLAIDFELKEQDINVCVRQGLLLQHVGFSMFETKMKMTHFEEDIVEIMWNLLKILSEEAGSTSNMLLSDYEMPKAPISHAILEKCSQIIQSREQLRKNYEQTMEKINKINIYEKHYICLANQLTTLMMLYSRVAQSSEIYQVSQQKFLKIASRIINNPNRHDTVFRNVMNPDEVARLFGRRLILILNFQKSKLFCICQFLRSQQQSENRLTYQEIESIFHSLSPIEKIQGLLHYDLDQALYCLKAAPFHKAELETFISSLIKHQISDQTTILHEITRMKFNYYESLLLKKLLVPQHFNEDLEQRVGKYYTTDIRIDKFEFILIFSSNLGIKLQFPTEQCQTILLSEVLPNKIGLLQSDKKYLVVFDDMHELKNEEIQRIRRKVQGRLTIVMTSKIQWQQLNTDAEIISTDWLLTYFKILRHPEQDVIRQRSLKQIPYSTRSINHSESSQNSENRTKLMKKTTLQSDIELEEYRQSQSKKDIICRKREDVERMCQAVGQAFRFQTKKFTFSQIADKLRMLSLNPALSDNRQWQVSASYEFVLEDRNRCLNNFIKIKNEFKLILDIIKLRQPLSYANINHILNFNIVKELQNLKRPLEMSLYYGELLKQLASDKKQYVIDLDLLENITYFMRYVLRAEALQADSQGNIIVRRDSVKVPCSRVEQYSQYTPGLITFVAKCSDQQPITILVSISDHETQNKIKKLIKN